MFSYMINNSEWTAASTDSIVHDGETFHLFVDVGMN